MCQTQYQNPATEEMNTFSSPPRTYGFHSNGLDKRIPPSFQQRQQIHVNSNIHVNWIHILHTTQIQTCRGRDKCLHQPHLLSIQTIKEDILTDNGTEFKNKLWSEVFNKLRTEQKFTPIYSPQCDGRIEGFHKFLKATIAKQLENCVEWDDLVWKATAAYNFFPMESSGIAPFFHCSGGPFFLMFRTRNSCETHPVSIRKSKVYVGMDNSMINIELMSKLYLVVAHNLSEARKARDGNKKKKNTAAPEQLKIGDNVLVKDHTSKAFQPKYKDFYMVGLLGKNQVEIKDNHGYTTKVHCRDVKKIPMTEKVCQLYEEEQIGKVRNGRKAIP